MSARILHPFRQLLSALLICCSFAPGQALPAELPSVELPAELARVLRDYEHAWAGRSPEGLADLFTADGFVLSRGKPPRRGRAAIIEHYRGSGGPLALRALDFAMEGDVAYIIGAYAAKPGDPDIGKFTLTLRRRGDGRWLIVSDMDNGNG